MVKFTILPQSHATTLSVFIFVHAVIISNNCDGSAYTQSGVYPSSRFSRQLGFGGYGPQPYTRQRQSTEATFFQSLMSLNFDLTEILAMYSNVTAVTETPACFGHCRTPIALWMVQSFYPCYNLKKLDCPRGLVCCVQDPSIRVASANTIQDTRIRGSGKPSSVTDVPDKPTESTTLFNEEWYKNNFIQDEIPE